MEARERGTEPTSGTERSVPLATAKDTGKESDSVAARNKELMQTVDDA